MKTHRLLWVVQLWLAAIVLFAGGMKLFLPLEALTLPIALPWPLIRFLGVAEVFGAIGLVLPWSERPPSPHTCGGRGAAAHRDRCHGHYAVE